ncbi:MAG: PH domain-containing protein [Acidobacteriota bacterium]|nr:PH domain-containing protein [Acidobacteriota bacterium]
MPVITCPDCGRDVSTLATACPHCGRPSPAGMVPPPASGMAAPLHGAAAPRIAAREETLWQGTPSPTLLAGHIFMILVVLIGIPLLARFFGSTMPDESRAESLKHFAFIAAAILVTIQALMLLVAWIRLRSTSYTITNQRVLIEQGVFTKTVDELDLRYLDDSQFMQTFVDRILGIGDVTLISSDKTSPRTTLRSVKDPRAVREMIRAEAYQNSQRQIFTRAT